MSNKELLFSITKKDLEITYFSGHGAGGQHRNRHKNCVRIYHKDSGVTVQATEQRSLLQNKKMAFKRLTEHKHFKQWLRIKSGVEYQKVRQEEQMIERLKREVEQEMRHENLRVERKVNGKWVL